MATGKTNSCTNVIMPGTYTLGVEEDGNLYAYYSDGYDAPAFDYDSETGNLYYVTGE